MIDQQVKKILISHSDLDGIGSVVLSKHYKIDFDEIYICDYDEIDSIELDNILKESKYLVCADFSFSEKEMDEIIVPACKEGKKIVYIYDHHESSMFLNNEKYKNIENLYIVHDKERSGTKIFFEEYIKNVLGKKRNKLAIVEFVNLVSTYDLYQYDSELWEKALSLNRLIYRQINFDITGLDRYSEFIEESLKKLEKDTFEFTDYENKLIEKVINDEKNDFRKIQQLMQVRVDNKRRKFILFYASRKISYMAFLLLKKYVDVKYIIGINTFYLNAWQKISVRSRDENEFDCLWLEGTGGHKCAAGMECELEFSKKLWSGEIKQLEYKK